MASAIRRVVTGHRSNGRSSVLVIRRTRTIDYVIVLEGEIDLLLDEGEVRLAAGDVVVQRGTNHAWINRGNAVCRLGMVFIDAQQPAEIMARRE